jgi:cell division protease FtsH
VAPRAREEEWGHNREWYMADIKLSVASYAAEMIKFGSTSDGVGGSPNADFYRALRTAHDMVWRYGMGPSKLIGDFHSLTEYYDQHNYISEQTRQKLDEDVQAVLQGCLKECFDILNEHRDLLDYFAQQLLDKGELEYDEIEAIFAKFNVKPRFRPPLLELTDDASG